MPEDVFGPGYGENAAENHERYFVPAIGAPVAGDLIEVAAIQPGERVLDVACGTGVLTRLASESTGQGGTVAGLDVNPAMLATARATTPPGMAIEWYEASAEKMPFPDASFDVVLCQMGLQFIPDKVAALSEMRRVLAADGRLITNLPGPTAPAFKILSEALGRQIGPEAAGFVDLIFSLHDTKELQTLLRSAEFAGVSVEVHFKSLSLPAPEEFLWQFAYSTPLAGALASAGKERLASLEEEVLAGWKPLVRGHSWEIQVRMVTATARKE